MGPNPRSRRWGLALDMTFSDGPYISGPMTKSEAEKLLAEERKSGYFRRGMVLWSDQWEEWRK